MKIVCIYGDDTLGSYKRFAHIIAEIRKRGWEHLPVNSSLSETLASGSLFSTERLISASNASKISTKEYTWLHKHNDEYEGRLLLYFHGSVPAVIKKLLPKTTTYEEFKLKKELFEFLEMLAPGRGGFLLKQFHKIIETDAPELVLAMLARQLRDLAWIKMDPKSMNIPDWKKRRLQNQAAKFGLEKLQQLVSDVSEADIKSKSGQGEIVQLLDLIFIKL